MFDINITQCPYTDFSSILASVIGGLITGFFSWLATKLAHEHNRQLKEDETKFYEKATVLSIIEELKVFTEEYQNKFNEQFLNIAENKYLNFVYTITPNCTTVFVQNSRELGLIKNIELRNLIIKSYLLLNKYIENANTYNISANLHIEKRRKFMSIAYPNMVSQVSSQKDIDNFIDEFLRKYSSEYKKIINESNATEAQIVSYINNEQATIKNLCRSTNDLKRDYNILIKTIQNTISKANELYGE
ncbi:hypothetical protein IJ707_03660 [bacterium]|nr:hypothetical protein [bacterium]